ncbi:hypothetical protein JQ586_17420 [Bradyrhizobium jicamae]|nr:hypothetical protein [Bradyrhizobium jicamae]
MIDCLCRGFPGRGRRYWAQALTRLSQRPAVADFPRYGLALEKSGRIVGVVMTLYSLHAGRDGDEVRCNLSSWSVDAGFRPYAAKLVGALLRQKGVTFTNISPAPATLKANEAIGFRLFSNGQFAFVPALNPVRRSCRVLEARCDLAEMALLSESERYTLSEHSALGCLSLICVCDGAVFPFVVVARRIGHGLIPCGQIVYCRSPADLGRCAGTIGRFLLRRGILLCLVDAKERIPGLFGRHFPNRGLRYFKGPKPPQLGDLTFTELVIFGP